MYTISTQHMRHLPSFQYQYYKNVNTFNCVDLLIYRIQYTEYTS